MSAIDRAKAKLGPLVQSKRPARCPSPDHQDKHASATLYPNGYFCHGCGAQGDTLDFYCLVNKIDTKEALRRLGVGSDKTYQPPPPPPLAIREFAKAFATKLVTKPEYWLALKWSRDIKRLNIPEETTLQCLTDKTFLDACRHKGFNPLLVHDLLFMEVA